MLSSHLNLPSLASLTLVLIFVRASSVRHPIFLHHYFSVNPFRVYTSSLALIFVVISSHRSVLILSVPRSLLAQASRPFLARLTLRLPTSHSENILVETRAYQAGSIRF